MLEDLSIVLPNLFNFMRREVVGNIFNEESNFIHWDVLEGYGKFKSFFKNVRDLTPNIDRIIYFPCNK
jgi:hypothetical protein